MTIDKKSFKKEEKKNFTMSLSKDVTERIHHVKKITNARGFDAYKNLNLTIYKWLAEMEEEFKISKTDYLNISLCPECSSPLKKIKTAKTEFIGCSSYPKCKYTKSI